MQILKTLFKKKFLKNDEKAITSDFHCDFLDCDFFKKYIFCKLFVSLIFSDTYANFENIFFLNFLKFYEKDKIMIFKIL